MQTDEQILQLLEQHEITDQAHLQALLAERGHTLTQPTLSRHLKKLQVRKVDGRYRRVEASAAEFSETKIRYAPPNLIVLKTPPGFAPALAYALDEKLPKELVAGTVAGEDTVLVAVAEPSKMHQAAAALKHALNLT